MFSTIICALLLSSTIELVQSKYSYVHNIKRWVQQERRVATWQSAKQHCDSDGAILASPIDTELFNYMENRINVQGHSGAYFIGIRATPNSEDTKVKFASIEGTLLNDLPEEVLNKIGKIDPRDGACLAMDRRGIKAVPCWERLPFMCYSNETKRASTPPGKIKNDCGSGYAYYKETDSCYKMHYEESMWQEANNTCGAEGGHLAVINDKREAELVRDISILPEEYFRVWVGVRNMGEAGNLSDWRSALGDGLEGMFNEWATERINDSYHDCGTITGNAQLDDMSCYNSLYYICEKDQ